MLQRCTSTQPRCSLSTGARRYLLAKQTEQGLKQPRLWPERHVSESAVRLRREHQNSSSKQSRSHAKSEGKYHPLIFTQAILTVFQTRNRHSPHNAPGAAPAVSHILFLITTLRIALVSSRERKRRQPGLAPDGPALVGRHQLAGGIQRSKMYFDFIRAARENG